MSNICVENGIEMYCLDLGLFAVLKQKWKDAVREFQVENIGEFVTKRTFANVFRSAWEKSTTIEVELKGFMEAGLFPSSVTNVDASVPTMTTVNVPITALDHAASSVTEIPETASVGSSSTTTTCDTAVPGASFQVDTNIPVKGPESPFSKHLKFPTTPASSSKKKKSVSLPKAITGHDYRKL
ncbi:hypothetical protein DPMN_109377 [Dreissena polymorpha]|uniref:Uncharacterized protein n=1 Tax=Dreissena polymorpha TaxID=45954 RepID=A0A9D4QLX8_DREPO|nr:hypothetical protein DPMN_109377 [Dreissena polymorpha]